MSDNVPAKSNDNALIEFLDRIIRAPEVDVTKMREILDIQTTVRREQAMQSFNAAMARVQEAVITINRSGRNPTFNNPYAKIEDLDRAARPIYSANGFSIRYGTGTPPREGWVAMQLTISHVDGYSETHELSGPIDTQSSGARARTPIQAVGSTVTYLRRYLLQMVLNLVPAGDPSDDDGEGGRRTKDPPPGSRPNGQQIWWADFERDQARAPTPEDKTMAFVNSLGDAWNDLTMLERFTGVSGWLAYQGNAFPPDVELLKELLANRIEELRFPPTNKGSEP